ADGTYTIDSAYMARVKQVVDAAISANLFVIVNIHNDGGNGVEGMWLDITKTGSDFTAVQNKFAGVWSSIANTFADYDQKLIFEGFNELNNGNYNADPETYQLNNVNALNQTFVTAVRNAGGNNSDRVLIVNGYNANIDNTVNGFVKPNDNGETDRLMLSVHYYDPYDFTLEETDDVIDWGVISDRMYMQNQLKKISDFANTDNIKMPVIIGEYGAVDKDNTIERATYLENLNMYAAQYDIVTAYWDNGVNGNYGFGLFNRDTNEVTTTGNMLIEAIMGI
ncbi:MAG: glycoside hydrolase family 5 protein, partial [Oscillospiraceae bacterium]